MIYFVLMMNLLKQILELAINIFLSQVLDMIFLCLNKPLVN
jgi:hypothetical protein